MKFYLIKNLLDTFGNADYKGLNIEQFVRGSQVCSYDLTECVIATYEDFQGQHEDLIELTEDEYKAEVKRIKSEYPPSPEEQEKELQTRLQEAEQAVLELSTIIGEMM